MAIRTYKVTLDSKNAIAPEPVLLRQGDKTGAVVIDATLMDNGSPVSISGLTPTFMANTADGQSVIADSTGFNITNASGGKFTYQVPSQLGSVPGKIKIAYFSFTDSIGNQSTFDIMFVVSKAADMTKNSAQDWISNLNEIIALYNQWTNDAHNFWEQFVNDNKEIIESIDPGGKVLSELIDFRRSDMLSKTFETAKLRGDFFDKSIQSLGVNIEWFGAVGDGITDNNNAIQTAINVAQSTGVNRVYIPEGIFYTSGVSFLINNMQIVGAGPWASVISTDKADPIFNLNNNSLIENIGIKQTSEIEAIGLGVESTEDPSSYWNVRIRHVHIFGPEVPSTGKGTWKLTGIKFDLNGKGLWDVTLDDINIEWVYDGVIADTYNQGWFTGSLYNNVTVKGFSNCAFGNISSNNTMRQISQNNFTNLTAETLYDAPDAVGFVVSGTGNEYDNLRLFGDGKWSGKAIKLKHFGDSNTDIKNPSFGKASCANNSFVGGSIEGTIDDPDSLRDLQHFDNLKLQVTDDNGILQQVIVSDEPHPNLLGNLTLSNMLDIGSQQSRNDKTSQLKSGSDEYGKYIEIKTGASGENWWYYFTEPDDTAGALIGHDHSLGIRFRAMTDGSTITNGRVRFNETEYPSANKLYYFTNPNSNGILMDYVWIYSNNNDYFEALNKDSRFDAALFNIAPNSTVRIYDAFLVSGRVTSFSRVSHINNFNNPKYQGGRNFIKNSNLVIGSDVKVLNQSAKSTTFEVDIDALNWMIGKNIVLSVDVNLHNYVSTNVTGRLAAFVSLDTVLEDGSTRSYSAGLPNTSTTLARDRYSFYYRLPDKRITSATCTIATSNGFTADYYQLGRPVIENGTVAHDYVPFFS